MKKITPLKKSMITQEVAEITAKILHDAGKRTGLKNHYVHYPIDIEDSKYSVIFIKDNAGLHYYEKIKEFEQTLTKEYARLKRNGKPLTRRERKELIAEDLTKAANHLVSAMSLSGSIIGISFSTEFYGKTYSIKLIDDNGAMAAQAVKELKKLKKTSQS